MRVEMPGILPIGQESGISGINGKSESSQAASGVSFSEYLQNALSEVNNLQKQSEDMNIKMTTGEITDLHNVMIVAEKANLALQLTVQVRNKVMEAYQEVMRMQV